MTRIPARLPLTIALLAAAAGASHATAAELSLELEGVRTAQGRLLVSVVDSTAAWDGQAEPVAGHAVAATEGRVRVAFPDLAPGTYAVMVMHDENGNGRLDTNAIGMPLEGYGFSRNLQMMRKPTFQEAAFDLPAEGMRLSVTMR